MLGAVAATATMVVLVANAAAGAITEAVVEVLPGATPVSEACLATPAPLLRSLPQQITTTRGLGPFICGLVPGL